MHEVSVFLQEDILDMLTWKHDISGQYVAKLGYDWLCSLNQNSLPERNWIYVWKLKAPEKIKVFIWLVGHRALLKNQEHIRRHLALNPTYSRCGLSSNDVFHYLKYCPKVRSIWEWLRLWESDFFDENDTFSWITRCASSTFAPRFLAGI